MGVAALLAALALLASCSQPAGPPVPGVVLITVDTLRADRLGSYGYRLDTSPNIDALAARGVRFEDVTVQWPKTGPSVASLMTGAYPKTTALGLLPRQVSDSLLLLGEVFREAGFQSAAVVANFNVRGEIGFAQGFDSFVESWQEEFEARGERGEFSNEPGKVKQYTNATLVTDEALRWLHSRDESRPFLLWLHYMDPHGPYVPPAKYGRYFEGEHRNTMVPPELLPEYQAQSRDGRPIHLSSHYEAQYDREIRYLDDELGRLFASLDELGIGDSLIVLTADHGESMGEHAYYFEHGKLPYQATAHVPLIIAQRGRISGGRAVQEPVGLIDLTPTIVELAGLPIPPSHEGVSLAGVIREEASSKLPPLVFMEGGYDLAASQLVVRDGRWKLVHVRSDRDRSFMTGAEFELYDLAADPSELTNVADRHPEIVLRMAAELKRWHEGGPRPADVGNLVDPEGLDERSQEMLEALGYME
jgi:arylsulfatase A-like enzyme